MPKQYEEIRDSYERRGKSAHEAKRLAAMTYNKLHPDNPNPWAKGELHQKPHHGPKPQ